MKNPTTTKKLAAIALAWIALSTPRANAQCSVVSSPPAAFTITCGSDTNSTTNFVLRTGDTFAGPVALGTSPLYPQYSQPLFFASGNASSTVFNLDGSGLYLRHNSAVASKILTEKMLADGVTNGLRVGSASFVLDAAGALAAPWNAGGHTISNAVFVGDGSGLANLPPPAPAQWLYFGSSNAPGAWRQGIDSNGNLAAQKLTTNGWTDAVVYTAD